MPMCLDGCVCALLNTQNDKCVCVCVITDILLIIVAGKRRSNFEIEHSGLNKKFANHII